MTLKRKVVYWSIGVLLTLLLTVVFFLNKSMVPSDATLINDHTYADAHTQVRTLSLRGHEVRVIEVANKTPGVRPKLYMIHGAPGGITAFSQYLGDSILRASYDLISYDRPGYSPEDMTPLPSIMEQADVLRDLIDQTSDSSNQLLLLSHSYGGAIGSLVTLELSATMLGHVMVAPVMDPENEPVFWYSGLPLKSSFKSFISPELYTASVEKMAHAEELKKVQRYWPELITPHIHFHGTEDWLAPAANIDFVARYYDKNMLTQKVYPERSHFILWSDDTFEDIRVALMELHSQVQ